jgi:outer membrane receptor protein involved in Fe transport
MEGLGARLRGPLASRNTLAALLAMGWTPQAMAQEPAASDLPTSAPLAAVAAQDADASNAVASAEIIVTGSRLASTGFTAPTPVTVLGEAQLQQLGDTNIAEALNRVPSFRAQNTPTTQGLGQANLGSQLLDLRGIGAPRTLVLVDGRRHVPTTTAGTFDISLIPSNIIERVEVVTGGASAAYGSDAVAGVVNLIIDNRLDGAKGEVQYGLSREGDNKEFAAALALGSDLFGGRGHITVAGEYVRNQGVGDCFSRKWCSPDGQLDYYTVANPGGAGAGGFPATVIGLVSVANMTTAGIVTSGPLRGVQFNANGSINPNRYQYGQLATTVSVYMLGGEGKNYFHEGLLISPAIERFSLYSNLNYDLTSDLRGTLSLSYGQVSAKTNAAYPLDSGNLVLRRDNAFLPAALATLMDDPNQDGNRADALTQMNFGRVTTEGGRPRTDAKRSVFRIVGALDGKINDNWSWDAYYQLGRADSDQSTRANKITANFNRAFDSVRNAQGVPVCRSSLSDPTNGCAPMNPFGVGNVSPAALGYVLGTSTSSFRFTQHAAAANVKGDLFEGWAGPLSVATGVEWRLDKARGISDPISTAAGFFNNNIAPIDGEIQVIEGYAETVAPLIRDAALTHLLELNGAIRQTHYARENSINAKTTVNTTTWKIGAVWEPIEAIRFRATRSRDIRAPNQVELYSGRSGGTNFITDPVNRQQYNVRILTGGNPNLTPERADTKTAGVVLRTPAGLVPGRLSLSGDYYDIKLKGAIATLGAQLIVNRCQGGAAEFCAALTRDPTTGFLTEILNQNLNLSSLQARGLDFEFNYQLPLSEVGSLPGTIGFRVLANRALELATIDPAGIRTDRAGQNGRPVSQDSGVPDWSVNADLSYSAGPFSATVQMRYLTGGVYNATLVGPEDANYAITAPNSISSNRVAGRTYINIAASFEVTKQFELFGAITNLFDSAPPIAPSSVGPYNSVLYDPIGQNFRFGARARF